MMKGLTRPSGSKPVETFFKTLPSVGITNASSFLFHCSPSVVVTVSLLSLMFTSVARSSSGMTAITLSQFETHILACMSPFPTVHLVDDTVQSLSLLLQHCPVSHPYR